nr:MAG TPA: Papain fold toxin 1, glutamine deamidase [Caudoviricetes sp.]
MSKKLTSKQQKEQLNNLFAVYNKRLGRLYSDYVKKLTSLGYGEDVFEDDALFNFDNFPQLKARLDDIFNDYYQNSLLCYKSGITDGVALAYNHDEMVIGGYSVLTDKAIRVARDTAAATFISNRLKAKNGLNLAQIVWNYCQQTKSEFEMAMSNTIADGIGKGSSAEEIGKSIRRYLNDTDMMYRRYHTIKVQKNGKKKDVVTWRRRRIIDGKVRFIEEPLEKVGIGVYRSARKNALRVARTEINAAYHKARNERWKNEPFVIGQYIHVSPQHNIDDICNDLEGRYPKDFDWRSWHSNCICTSDPITIQGEEKKEFYKRLMAGEDMSNYVSPFAVLTMPEKYNQYIRDNSEAIVKAGMRGKLAWHLQDNTKYWAHLLSPSDRKKLGLKAVSSKEAIAEVAKVRHAKRDAKAIQKAWTYRRMTIYEDKMDKLRSKLTYSKNILSGALAKRYEAVYKAIQSPNSWSVANIEYLYKRFADGIAIREHWDKLLWDGFSKEQITNCRELEKKLGILKGRPMNWERADQQNANPNYLGGVKNGYQDNCATCSPTYMLRLWGFNVTARNSMNPAVDYLSHGVHTWEKWLNKDGSKATWVKLSEWKDAKKYKEMTAQRYKEFIDETCREEGVYEMCIGWSNTKGDGHSTIIQRFKDGSLKRIDAQVYYKKYFNMDEKKALLSLCQGGQSHAAGIRGYIWEGRGIMRIDNKLFNLKHSAIFEVVK